MCDFFRRFFRFVLRVVFIKLFHGYCCVIFWSVTLASCVCVCVCVCGSLFYFSLSCHLLPLLPLLGLGLPPTLLLLTSKIHCQSWRLGLGLPVPPTFHDSRETHGAGPYGIGETVPPLSSPPEATSHPLVTQTTTPSFTIYDAKIHPSTHVMSRSLPWTISPHVYAINKDKRHCACVLGHIYPTPIMLPRHTNHSRTQSAGAHAH